MRQGSLVPDDDLWNQLRDGHEGLRAPGGKDSVQGEAHAEPADQDRSEEHTSELQSLMRISYAVFCLKKKKKPDNNTRQTTQNIEVTHYYEPTKTSSNEQQKNKQTHKASQYIRHAK